MEELVELGHHLVMLLVDQVQLQSKSLLAYLLSLKVMHGEVSFVACELLCAFSFARTRDFDSGVLCLWQLV